MASDLSGLSKETIAELGKTLSKAADLTERQIEILDTILAGEAEIGKKRISYLTEYFDTYSKNLDNIARRTSNLSDGFLILEKQANEIKENFALNTNNSDSNSNSSNSSSNSPTGSTSKEVASTIEDTKRSQMKEPADDDGELLAGRLSAILSGIEGSLVTISEINDFIDQHNKERYDNQNRAVNEIYETELKINALKQNSAEDQKNSIIEISLANTLAIKKAEESTLELLNNLDAQYAYSSEAGIAVGENNLEINKAGADRAALVAEQNKAKALQVLDKQMADRRALLEYEARKKYNGKLSAEEATRIEKQLAEEYELRKEHLEELAEEQFKEERKTEAKKNRAGVKDIVSGPLSEEDNLFSRFEKLSNLSKDADGKASLAGALKVATVAISSLAKQLESEIDEIASHKGNVDTRLAGSNNKTWAGSYWDQIVHDITGVGAVNPFFKQKDFAKNIEDLVEKGIAFNLEQRAFLMTIKDKIATTFEAADATLLRLIRIQQEDSTAGRLGMEAALNAFLNNMYENTEYLKEVATGVRSSLEEMQSLMQGAEAAEVEYQVQKWLGSLYSVGMSKEATSSLAAALGQIAAGQIEGLTNGGAGNLLIMAANDAGIPIADILTRGITAKETNTLLQAAVNYLAELAAASEDNKVVQQQLASVFGVKASDLRAATNLVGPGSTSSIFGSYLTYDNMLKKLNSMAGSMYSRTSLAEMMTNVWANGQYSLAGSMASNPVSYLIYKMATVLDNTAGGIGIPSNSFAGTGVDLEITVADIMRVASMATGILGSLGPMLAGLGNSFSGQAMLRKMGIAAGSGLTITPRGTGDGLLGSTGGGAQSISGSGYVGNASGSDIKDSTLQEAEDSKKKNMIKAQEESEETPVQFINQTVLKIYELLDDVANGNNSFKVRLADFGLTKSGGSSGSAGLNSDAGHTTSSSSSASSSNFGGWTTTL